MSPHNNFLILKKHKITLFIYKKHYLCMFDGKNNRFI